MTNESEVTLPEGGTELVSSSAPKKRIKEMTPEEKKKYNREAAKRTREKAGKKAEKAARERFSEAEVSKKDAKRILLDERQIQNDHVADTIVELAEVAARHYRIPFNAHLFTHGLRATLNARESEEAVAEPSIQPEEVKGEILYRTDLHGLWDMGFFRHEDSFDQWLADRFRYKSSAFALSQLLNKIDFGATHESWERFLPHWSPLGLRPNYTQQDALAWLDSQRSDVEGDKKRYLLVASRNSMKSTFIRIHALQLALCCPDSSVLIVSETNKLAKKALKEYKGYLTKAANNPTKFQQYFSEFCAPINDAGQSNTYENPLAHLGLPQAACESSSMESANTGSRFWYCVFDDPITRDNGTANDEQKEAAISKHGSIMKLREPAGFATNVQTPWASGDLGDVMIKRNEEDPEHALAVRIDPVMTIHPEAARKKLLELTEDDVTPNFLPKLNWRFIRGEMRSPEGIEFFKSQYMTEWPLEESDEIKLNFDYDLLVKSVVPMTARPVGEIYLTADVAYSNVNNKYADNSALAAVCIHRNSRGESSMCVLGMEVGRMRGSELAANIVKYCRIYQPRKVIIEKGPTHDLLQDEINRISLAHGIPVPIYWATPSNQKGAKLSRLKALEMILVSGRLSFLSGAYIDTLFSELTKLQGKKSTSTRKDDQADSLSIGVKFLLKSVSLQSEEDTTTPQEREEEFRRALMQAGHQRMFSEGASSWTTARTFNQRNEPPPPTEPQRPLTPREQAMQRMMSILPPGLRRRG